MRILIIFIIIFVALAFVRIRLIAEFSNSKKYAAVKIGFVKINLFTKTNKKSNDEKDEKLKENIGSFKEMWYNSENIKKALLRLKRRVLIEKFVFEYSCGFSDAAVTAVMYGTVYGLYCNIFSFLNRHFRVKNMNGDISADFNTKKKNIAVKCILRLTVADIIYIFAAVLPIIKKQNN